jgi:hypothetical protein
VFCSVPLFSSSTMAGLKVLGYANSQPCEFLLDRASPVSQVSAAFLFRNSFYSHLNSSARQYAYLTLAIPSRGGYFTSTNAILMSSTSCGSDIVLGADWLASCRISTAANVIMAPGLESVGRLDVGHTWTADGMQPSIQ